LEVIATIGLGLQMGSSSEMPRSSDKRLIIAEVLLDLMSATESYIDRVNTK
jgi:hypothetical protein